MTRQLFFFSVVLFSFFAAGQSFDVQHYSIHLSVSDTSDMIEVNESVKVLFSEPTEAFILDLQAPNGRKGMEVRSVKQSGTTLVYKHKGDQLIIRPKNIQKGTEAIFQLFFTGTPEDGLVIGKNKYGDRTFFGDNWPNRAHQWFACADHPSDKATVEFMVTAPDHYTCVSNGAFVGRKAEKGYATTTYRSMYKLPTKVMVIGLADMVEQDLTSDDGFIVKNFVYPKDKEAGFHDMEVAMKPLLFYDNYVAPYPFEKLYNVQSTTRFGGMENAGCIFYDEGAVKGDGSMESLIAHEIAHQWFGNSASESDWPHLWLSEGFATYFTNLYLEHEYGIERMQEQLIKDRNRVIRFSRNTNTPVIDTISTDLMYLLNPNSYQKGSWVLHMLRNKIGDQPFQKGIREYYRKYAYANASSNDFKVCMEKASGQDLTSFFNQWLRRSGHPVLHVKKMKKGDYEMLQILQEQDDLFQFPLEIEMNYGDTKETVTVEVSERETIVPIKISKTLEGYKLDPQVKILFEANSGN